ncbi:MAG: hypothetical protein OHK0012_21580 [Synechococcales cyanobacterium]
MGALVRVFKAIFGGIFGFFGILFGGVVSSVAGAFQPAASTPPAMASTITADGRRPVVDLEGLSFSPNEIGSPRPNRRPGPALDGFKAIAKEVTPRR